MDIVIRSEEAAQITGAAEFILKIFSYAQGREESYAARREEIKVLEFPSIKNAPTGEEVKEENPKVTSAKETAFLKTYNKELSKMPQLQDKIKKAIRRAPRFHNGVYEKRALINGIELYSCSSNLDECETKFLNLIAETILSAPSEGKKATAVTLFPDWAEEWFEQVFKPNVTATTYSNEFYRYKNHIRPYFEKKKLREITPLDCVKYCNNLLLSGNERTAESCYGIVKRILQFAVESNLIPKNPMLTVKPIKAERKNGVPLSKEEELQLLSAVKRMKHEAIIALALYTGLRPCEHSSARIEGDFIVARNRKQKNVKKIVFKKIPITPMLKPFIPLIQSRMAKDWDKAVDGAHETLRKILPNHRLYDLRTTFATRCQECGVPENVVQEWLGHKPKTLLGQVYTKFSDDYLLSEGKKVSY